MNIKYQKLERPPPEPAVAATERAVTTSTMHLYTILFPSIRGPLILFWCGIQVRILCSDARKLNSLFLMITFTCCLIHIHLLYSLSTQIKATESPPIYPLSQRQYPQSTTQPITSLPILTYTSPEGRQQLTFERTRRLLDLDFEGISETYNANDSTSYLAEQHI